MKQYCRENGQRGIGAVLYFEAYIKKLVRNIKALKTSLRQVSCYWHESYLMVYQEEEVKKNKKLIVIRNIVYILKTTC